MCWPIPILVLGMTFSISAHARNWPSLVGEGHISRWSGDRVAAFTVTIDDNHAQDHEFWKALGEDAGLKWTWCVITENVGSGNGGTWAEWQELVDLGHGIASHGLHAYNESTQGINVTNEYRDSQVALTNNLLGVNALTLAYPNGLKPPNDKVLAADFYIAARGVVGGVNTGDSIDYMDPKSVSMNATTATGITDPGTWYYFGHTINPTHQFYEGWQSIHFHNVSASMVSGVTNLAAALRSHEEDIWIGRFQDVVQYGRERENATLTVDSVTSSEIRFTVSDTLDDTLFDFPLTIKLRIDSAWENVTALQGGTDVPVALIENDGNSYALVQAVPDAGQVVVRQGNSEGLLVVVRGPSKNRVWVDGAYSGPSSGTYDAPYQTIQDGLDAADAGETVTVRAGIYRERVALPSGALNAPITLSSASGERVVIHAMEPLEDWLPLAAGLYTASVGWAPESLYSGFQKMSLAREPNEGWWKAGLIHEEIQGGSFRLTDEANLKGFPYDMVGASVRIWTQEDDLYYSCPVVSFDSLTGQVEFERVHVDMRPVSGDKYCLQNHRGLIDQGGEWASERAGAGVNLFFRPFVDSDVEDMQVPPVEGRPITGQNIAHMNLKDLEIVGGADQGIYLQNVQDVTIDRCIIRNNQQHGLRVGGATDCWVKNSIFSGNRVGLTCEGSTNIYVEANEIGPNFEGGIVIVQNASNIFIRNNYLHDQLLWGHANNSQLVLGVSGVHLINNLMMTAGQSVRMAAGPDGEFLGNMVIGSSGSMVDFSQGSGGSYVVRGNTLVFAGEDNLAMSAQNYEVKENILVSGHGASMYTVSDAMNYQGDRNLFWNGERLVDPVLLVSNGAWGDGPSEAFNIVYNCNSLAAGASSVNGTSSHADVAVGSLMLPGTFPPSNWPNSLTALQNSAGIDRLASAVEGGDYFSFIVSPDALTTVSYSNLYVRVSLGANVQPATTVFTLLSSLTGFAASEALVAFTNETLTASTMGISNDLSLEDLPALQAVAPGMEIEFRLYAHNIGAHPMTRLGVGKAWGASADDLRLSGTVSARSSGGSPEIIYHTQLSTFQSTTGQDLNSVSGNPLFVNAPIGMHVMDNALLEEATPESFALRGANDFVVGDKVEVNFDGIVRVVTASNGLVLSIDPPLSTKPLRGGLLLNWGSTDDFSLDLRPQEGSPAVALRPDGGASGSSISVSGFQGGDFDGDGRRDLPSFPVDTVE